VVACSTFAALRSLRSSSFFISLHWKTGKYSVFRYAKFALS
jgi:hypothetical protein